MGQFGRTVHGKLGSSLMALASLKGANFKIGGVTIDWATVAAVTGADVELKDGTTIKIGKKYLRYGQVLCRIGVAEVQTYAWTGGPTAGSAILTLPEAGEGQPAQSTAPIAFDASAAVFQAALNALSRIGPNGATVGRTGAGSNADPYIYTVTYLRDLGNVPQMTAVHTFTGGTTPTVTPGTTTSGGASAGKFGPYDAAASDGRQLLARGHTFILNETWLEEAALGLTTQATDYPNGVFDTGTVFYDRLLATTAGAGTLALGPTFTTLEAAMPGITYVRD